MATKKKKGMNVELNNFDFDEQDIARMQQERAGAAERVAKFNKDFEPTGSAFKDTGLLSGTSRDIKTMRTIDTFLDKAADRAATVRAQDAGLEVERGKIGVDKTRNTLFGKQIDNQFELGKGELILGKGELDINRAILDMQQDRYKNVTKPSDKLSLAERAATARVGAAESGFELSEDLFKETSKYLKDGKPAEAGAVATPATPAPLDPLTSSTKIPQSFGYEPYPDVLESAPITNYGKGILPQIGGSAVEGIKLLGRTAARITAKDPLSPSRRYKRKVNK
jgi:hypothetical protein